MNNIPTIDPLRDSLIEAFDYVAKAHRISEDPKYDPSLWYRINEISFHFTNLLHSIQNLD